MAQRNKTPRLHQNTILLVGTLKLTPIPILIGAPTLMVPNKPKPITPYFSQIFKANPGSLATLLTLVFLNELTHFLMMLPRYAATKTPIKPPKTLYEKISSGCSLKANPAGIAAYISKVANPIKVRIL